MLEKALIGDRKYWTWVFILLGLMGIGGVCFIYQMKQGLGVTGLSRDIAWGFYIAQLTFLVGVAASAVMLVLPYYLHNYKAFGRITVLGEYLAVAAILMCLMFVFVDLGQPMRMFNLIRYPSPRSLLFWDSIVLNGYLVLNILISRVTLDAERKQVPPPKWIRPVILLSIPWAVSIHTVTAFLYSGLSARPFWLTAVLAPRFLASAFAAGPALLVLLCLAMRKFARYDVGREPIQKLAVITLYGMLVNVFLLLMEIFTAFYSDIPEHKEHLLYLFFGLEGHSLLVPWMWTSVSLAAIGITLLLIPKLRQNVALLAFGCIAVFCSIWIEKGLGMIIAGFVPSPLGHVTDYAPTLPELGISAGIYAFGCLVVTVLYKIALSVRGETRQWEREKEETVVAKAA